MTEVGWHPQGRGTVSGSAYVGHFGVRVGIAVVGFARWGALYALSVPFGSVVCRLGYLPFLNPEVRPVAVRVFPPYFLYALVLIPLVDHICPGAIRSGRLSGRRGVSSGRGSLGRTGRDVLIAIGIPSYRWRIYAIL